MIGELEKIDPKENVVVAAIRNLTSSGEIKEFFAEYVEMLRRSKKAEAGKSPKTLAAQELGMIAGRLDKEKASLWMTTLDSIGVLQLREK